MIEDPQKLSIRLLLNGEVMQDANTDQMVFSVAYLVSFISRAITLTPGDIIATGTPSGVGVFRDPPVLLKAGDEVKVVIEKLGVLSNPVVDEAGRRAKGNPEGMKRVFD
jgi:acylpyruvate hydrolase